MNPTNIRHDRPGMENWFRDPWCICGVVDLELRQHERMLLYATFYKIANDLPLTDPERTELYDDHRRVIHN